jgi:hypothetical protein
MPTAMPIASLNPFKKTAPEPDQNERDDDFVMKKLQMMFDERIFDNVRGRVRRRERNGDDKTRGDKAEQSQHEHFPLPARKQMFEHRDRTVAVRTFFSHALIHRQRPKSVSKTSTQVASGDSAPAARKAMPG